MHALFILFHWNLQHATTMTNKKQMEMVRQNGQSTCKTRSTMIYVTKIHEIKAWKKADVHFHFSYWIRHCRKPTDGTADTKHMAKTKLPQQRGIAIARTNEHRRERDKQSDINMMINNNLIIS